MLLTEILNLYDLHKNPKSLSNHDKLEAIPELKWKELWNKWETIIKKNINSKQAIQSQELMAWPGVKEDFKQYEHIWIRDPHIAFEYADIVLNRRWPAAEKIIASNSQSAYLYCCNILNRRWPAGEPAIAQNYADASNYVEDFFPNVRTDDPQEFLQNRISAREFNKKK